jgi:sugar phosphate isomerase/epimerase
MRKISIASSILHKASADIDAVCKMYKENGIDGVDFGFDCYTVANGHRDRFFSGQSMDELKAFFTPYKEAFERHGIEVVQTHPPFPTVKFVSNITSETIEEYNLRALDAVKKTIELTAFFGCKYAVVHPAHGVLDMDLDEQKKANMKYYSQLIDDARKFGVTICLENMWNRRDGGAIVDSACSNPYEAVDYIDTLNDMAGEEIFAFCFDVGHANLTGKNIRNYLLTLGKRVKVLHIHDTDKLEDRHTLPYAYIGTKGASVTDYVVFLSGLRDIGYEGHISFEVGSAFRVFPKPTHPALCSLFSSIGKYFISEIEK